MRLARPGAAATLLAAIGMMTAPATRSAAAASPTSPATPLPLAIVQLGSSCAALAAVDLVAIGGAGSKVVKASETTRSGVAVCSVDGTLAPSTGFRVDLPTATWTQRFMQLGCGGLCGRTSLQIGAAGGCPIVGAGGFVLAYCGVHLTRLAAHALIARYYGQAPRFSYFNGCSDGGREALAAVSWNRK